MKMDNNVGCAMLYICIVAVMLVVQFVCIECVMNSLDKQDPQDSRNMTLEEE